MQHNVIVVPKSVGDGGSLTNDAFQEWSPISMATGDMGTWQRNVMDLSGETRSVTVKFLGVQPEQFQINNIFSPFFCMKKGCRICHNAIFPWIFKKKEKQKKEDRSPQWQW